MRYLFILKQSPYQSSLARDALDFALASAAFDQQVSLVFMADGVYQLLKDQYSQVLQKNIEKTLQSLELFEVEHVYACQASLTARHITSEQLSLDVSSVNAQKLRTIIHQADKVFTF